MTRGKMLGAMSDPATFDADGALSRDYLASRGECCGNGCRNCPYDAADAADASPLPVRSTRCAKCDSVFQCGGPQCWCATVNVPAEKLEHLRKNYGDCLCPACLAHFASAEAT